MLTLKLLHAVILIYIGYFFIGHSPLFQCQEQPV